MIVVLSNDSEILLEVVVEVSLVAEEGVVRSLSNISITACLNVAAAVLETTGALTSCNLNRSSRAYCQVVTQRKEKEKVVS